MSQSNYHDGRRPDACLFCRARGVEEHHIIPQRFGGPDTEANTVSVCTRCHEKLEQLYDASFYEWFGVDDEPGERRYHRPCFRCDGPGEAQIHNTHHGHDIACVECATELADRFDHVQVVEVADG